MTGDDPHTMYAWPLIPSDIDGTLEIETLPRAGTGPSMTVEKVGPDRAL